ncbi:hypothetical protein GYMLUDRAFT_249602 [Collybiopsis luxurians FD-317 M1]|uniref:Uncharacterized protein n=1 Tax=Collybiopsis luxurians FD-317 M1 TaxID=944289 RepID=A0A0D0BHL6_9AGAR|nr:hypothetical protein GYMLUDRAFT_249602 [Collybiopsis luxurians FD-317 M1]
MTINRINRGASCNANKQMLISLQAWSKKKESCTGRSMLVFDSSSRIEENILNGMHIVRKASEVDEKSGYIFFVIAGKECRGLDPQESANDEQVAVPRGIGVQARHPEALETDLPEKLAQPNLTRLQWHSSITDDIQAGLGSIDLRLPPMSSRFATGSTYSGPIPWLGCVVLQVVHGPYKSCQGAVQDVNHSLSSISGLTLRLQLFLSTTHGVNPSITIDYEDVHEVDTWKALAEKYPLKHNQSFFHPNCDYIPAVVDKPYIPQPMPELICPPTPQPPPSEDVFSDAESAAFWRFSPDDVECNSSHWILHPAFAGKHLFVSIDLSHSHFGGTSKWVQIDNGIA